VVQSYASLLRNNNFVENLQMYTSTEYPDFFARFYDTIYEKMRDATDHTYFLDKLLDVKSPVLEIGVGTGRFFTDALNKGVDIYGVDISPHMIDVLKKKLPENEHNRVKVQDICKLDLDLKFRLIIAPFRVFMHILDIEDQISALNKVHDHLEPGGYFIFDLFVPNLKMLHEGLDQFKDFEGEYEPGKKLIRYSSMNADPVNQISRVTFKLVWEEDGAEFEKSWTTKMRFFFRYEIEHLIARSKLTLENIYGDFCESALTQKSKEFIVVCRR
jgi:SAM-dependent methyltransferase